MFDMDEGNFYLPFYTIFQLLFDFNSFEKFRMQFLRRKVVNAVEHQYLFEHLISNYHPTLRFQSLWWDLGLDWHLLEGFYRKGWH